jgi:tRNA1(Val) A37 N6-methylase TrmN6
MGTTIRDSIERSPVTPQNVSRTGPTRHRVQCYVHDESMLEEAARFLASAVRPGGAAIVIATPEHRTSILRRLRNLGLDVEKASSEGRIIPADAAEVLSKILVNGLPDWSKFEPLIVRATVPIAIPDLPNTPPKAAMAE